MSNIEVYARFGETGNGLYGHAQRGQYFGWFQVASLDLSGMLRHECGGRRHGLMGAQTGSRRKVELGFSTTCDISQLQAAADQGRSFSIVEIEIFRDDYTGPHRISNYRLEPASLSNFRLGSNQWLLDVSFESMRSSDFGSTGVPGWNIKQNLSV